MHRKTLTAYISKQRNVILQDKKGQKNQPKDMKNRNMTLGGNLTLFVCVPEERFTGLHGIFDFEWIHGHADRLIMNRNKEYHSKLKRKKKLWQTYTVSKKYVDYFLRLREFHCHFLCQNEIPKWREKHRRFYWNDRSQSRPIFNCDKNKQFVLSWGKVCLEIYGNNC